jgi:hypothetical protein
MLTEELQGQLLHYEETLRAHGFDLPYIHSIKDKLVKNEWSS